jgi:hypothetical protein
VTIIRFLFGSGQENSVRTHTHAETGIADARDDRRGPFIDAYFQEVMRALADGYDVRGFFYWTLIDNFEWSVGFTSEWHAERFFDIFFRFLAPHCSYQTIAAKW